MTIVAVAPGLVEDEPAQGERLGEAGDVEPVPAPSLAEVGRGQQAVDEVFVGGGRRVGDEGRDLFRRGRQADEVEREPPDEGRAVGLWRRAEVLGFETPRGRIGRCR